MSQDAIETAATRLAGGYGFTTEEMPVGFIGISLVPMFISMIGTILGNCFSRTPAQLKRLAERHDNRIVGGRIRRAVDEAAEMAIRSMPDGPDFEGESTFDDCKRHLIRRFIDGVKSAPVEDIAPVVAAAAARRSAPLPLVGAGSAGPLPFTAAADDGWGDECED